MTNDQNQEELSEEPLPCNCTETDIMEGTCDCADIMPPDDAAQTMGCIVKKVNYHALKDVACS